ncbi:MAG: GatB/YqeY domain-containing protein [Roseibium sp.]|uniref:GatB/YqeY domain-containing protein n=1 Tax=Roseibium sp. TaxID=1936156 RepID=UPI00329A48A5
MTSPILASIKKKSIMLRKDRSPAASTLITLQGELETRAKSLKPPRDLTDDEVIAEIKSTLKKVNENIDLYEGRGMKEAAEAARAEKALLEDFLPQQMTDDEIRAFVRERAAGGADLGAIMKALKAEKAGLFDGKSASAIVRDVLSA